MITKVLRRPGVLGASESADASDSALAGDVLDSLHDQLRKEGLAPYATSSFPEWAQEPFTKCLEEDLAPYFGKSRQGAKGQGMHELAAQVESKRHARSTEASFF